MTRPPHSGLWLAAALVTDCAVGQPPQAAQSPDAPESLEERALRRSGAVTAAPIRAIEPANEALDEPSPDSIVRFDQRSPYEQVIVVDEGHLRYMRFGEAYGDDQSVMSLVDPDRIEMDYIRFALLGAFMPPKVEHVLMIGLGGGTFTTGLRRLQPNIDIDAVEIDPIVVEAAKTWFGVTPDERLRVHVADGAEFITRKGPTYDAIFLDAYSSDAIPEAVGTTEFLQRVRGRLSTDGIVILNISLEDELESQLWTRFRSVFSDAACLRTEDDLNLVVFGRTTALPTSETLAERLRGWDAKRIVDLPSIARELRSPCHERR